MVNPAGMSLDGQSVLPRVGPLMIGVGFVGCVASCLLLVIEEEAA